jgi:hypothetical protein
MATVVVTRNGSPVKGARVKAVSTFGFSKYDQEGNTDRSGEAEFRDNANRFRIYVDGRDCGVLGSLSGTNHIRL